MRRWLVGAALWLLLALAVADIHGCGVHRGKRKRNGWGKWAF